MAEVHGQAEEPEIHSVNIIPKRIGIVLANKGLEIPSLKYFVLSMNNAQQHFEYEFLLRPENDDLIKELTKKEAIDQDKKITPLVAAFLVRYKTFLTGRITHYELSDQLSDYIVIVSLAKFSDHYYILRKDGISIIALGDWEHAMAPPSLLEFIQTLIVRESVASICPPLRGSVHLGTRGCLCDFTPRIDEARLKVLSGFLCHYCRSALATAGFPTLATDLQRVLGRRWIGRLADPTSPAGILAKLGSNLFVTRGLKPTFWENLLLLLQNEGIKGLIKLAGVVLAAVFLAYLGLKP